MLATALAVWAALVAALGEREHEANPTNEVRVALFQGKGVSPIAFEPTRALLTTTPGFTVLVVGGIEIRAGALDHADVVLFIGGSGSRQGAALEEEGRKRVREFVAAGGGYVGICAGGYLAMQGEPEFNKLGILAARNRSGDAWKRGVAPVDVRPNDGSSRLRMHFANGPVFVPASVEGIAPYVALATFASDLHASRHGTSPGEMPGTPAILAARYAEGRLLLFSPNPVLGAADVGHPELLLDGLRWVVRKGPVPATLEFRDVFGGQPCCDGH